MERHREAKGRKTRGKEEEKRVTVVACAASRVCLCMSVAACMHVLLHTFMHDRVCFVSVCSAHGRWVGVVGTARAIYSCSLT